MALTFDYKVRDRSGGLVEGQLDGDSMALVVKRLRDMGYMPVSVTPRSSVNLKTEIKIPGLSDRVKLREVAIFTRQLSTMVDSGLSVACTKHPKVFSQLYCTLIAAGEAGGNLDEVLGRLAATIENQAALNKTIRSAMTYPAVVLSVMVLVFAAMLVFIVPVFKKLFSSLGGQLPFPTRVLIQISQILTSVWVLLVIGVVIGAVIGLRRWIATEDGRRKWDRLVLRPPVFGPLFHKIALARMTMTLASLISSGVPILEALDLSSEVAGNRTVGDVLLDAKNAVREGRPLADALREHEKAIPVLVTQMIEVGEQTGSLDGMLQKVAEFYDQEVQITVKNLTSLLEPILTVIMGAGVGAMVICLYLPMFDYVKLVPNAG